jgi:hypothetical protein
VSANRSRSAPAYLLPHSGGTAMPGATPRYPRCPGWLLRRRLTRGTPSRPPRKTRHAQPPGFADAAHRPSDVRLPRKRQSWPENSSWVLRAAPVTRAQQPVRALRRCRRRPPAGTG